MSSDISVPGWEPEQGKWLGRSDVVRWLEIALLQDLDQLLDAIIQEVPETVGARDCSIYLLPQFVSQFDGVLMEGNLSEISHTAVDGNFIVSARSTKPSPCRPYGKAFYRSGEGLTGWVFEQRRPLLLRNMWDQTERTQITPVAFHSDKYGLGRELGPHPQPFLAMPLQTAGREPVGVLKLTGTRDSSPFPAEVQDFLQPVVRALADLIQRTANLERMKGMKRLMTTLAAASSLRDVLHTAAIEMPALVDGSHCSIFLLDEKTGYYVLRATTSDLMEGKVDMAYYQSGEGLTGWVASKKRPLRLKNLTDRAELEAIDRQLRWLDKDEEYVRRPTRQFLAAPLLSTKESEPALGVIRFAVHRFNQSFTLDDERLLVEFTTSFVQILEAVRVRELSGQISAIKDLFLASTLDRVRLLDEAVRSTDRVLGGDGCSLFLKDERSGLYVLRATSALSLAKEVGLLAYAEGEGKTGRAIRERSALRLNPVEEPEVSVKDSVEADIQAGAKFLAAPLLADNGEPMGVIRLTRQQKKPDFAQVDENLLSSIASMLGLSLQTLAAHETHQQITKALLRIAETNVRLVRDQDSLPLDLRREQSRWLALTTVTSHDGLRFNRAALFTHTEDRTVMGVCAVGPGSLEEADRLWTRAKGMSFDELVELNIEEAHGGRGFNEMIAGQKITLEPDEAPVTTLPLATCVEARAFRVQHGQVELLMSHGFVPSDCSIPQRFLNLVDCDCFALIPFSGLDDRRGILYVDNRFNGRPISMDQVRPLTVFAEFFRTSMSLAEARDRLLLRSGRLATLGEFATSFSHQARQPLQIISAAVKLMEEDPCLGEPEVLRKRLAELREGVDRIDGALRYLNGFSRREFTPTREFVKVGETLLRVVEFVEAQLKNRGIRLELDIPTDLPDVLASRADLEDILLNLIANARDAMEGEGGVLTLRALAHEVYVAIEVSDTGCGITENDRNVVFEPLFSTKPTEKGMGMGLALSRRLAEQMGGALSLATNDRPLCGSTFVLHVPIGGSKQ